MERPGDPFEVGPIEAHVDRREQDGQVAKRSVDDGPRAGAPPAHDVPLKGTRDAKQEHEEDGRQPPQETDAPVIFRLNQEKDHVRDGERDDAVAEHVVERDAASPLAVNSVHQAAATVAKGAATGHAD